MRETILEVENLKTFFFTHRGVVKAVDGVSLNIRRGENVGIVGESGCGKSVFARSIMRLIPNPPGRIVDGEICFLGENLLEKTEKQMQGVRGNAISMVFQEPMTSLNPIFTVGNQLVEVFRKHQKLSPKDSLDKAVQMLKMVGIPSPETRVQDYPFQMSGGMRQRVMIAMALACRPQLILADEPTTALDVTIQAQILSLIRDLEQELGTSMILITHNLGVIAETVNRVVIMYAGQVLEEANVDDLFAEPLHPYSEGLMWSVLPLEQGVNKDMGNLPEIPGIVPDLTHLPRGCYFYPRCHKRLEICLHDSPALHAVRPGRQVRCWLYQ
jgi:peptide/nickel transport system ATP-binding protein/oligopeptide transport system ATP-binding protein